MSRAASASWTPADVPDQSGRRVLVTGVTSGLGRQTALGLARAGAEVVLGARDPHRLEETTRSIAAEVPGAALQPLLVDLSDLGSVRRAASEVTGPLHVLVHNAGVMATPHERTGDGFDLQHATNHLGPFALTGLLLPRLVESGDGRVVAVSSLFARLVRTPPLDDPRVQRGRYQRWGAYARSKLANLMFVLELERRARDQQVPVTALAAHPGHSSTALMGSGRRTPGAASRVRLTSTILQAAFEAAGQPAELGALPILMAATADLPGATYVGPDGPLQLNGHPRVVSPGRLAQDRAAQRRLWEISEDATGVRYLDG